MVLRFSSRRGLGMTVIRFPRISALSINLGLANTMAVLEKIIRLILIIFATVKAQGEQPFGVIQPFPENIYPLEYTSANVTCITFDASGKLQPDRIEFYRRDDLHRYRKLGGNRFVFNQRTENIRGNIKLYTTMTLKNVTIQDDSQYGELGSYECHAFAKNVSVPKRHGFSVSVITRNEIPTVKVSVSSVLNPDDGIIIFCNLTRRGNENSTPLKRISWFKDGKLLESVRNPDPDVQQDFLAPLKLTKVDVQQGGKYTCLLEVKLRHIKEYDVTDYTVIKREPPFGVIQPFPENIYPIEYTSANVTCITFDASGKLQPDRIEFYRRDDLNRYRKLGGDRFVFNQRTENIRGNIKLYTTMTLKNVTIQDDSQYGELGSYECHAFAKNVSVPKRHGFSVSVITRNEIPTVKVSVSSVLNPDDGIIIFCNLTRRGHENSTPLKRISWFKDGKLLESVRNPDPDVQQGFLAPLKLTKVDVQQGGKYTCLLEVKLRHIKEYNVTDYTVIKNLSPSAAFTCSSTQIHWALCGLLLVSLLKPLFFS